MISLFSFILLFNYNIHNSPQKKIKSSYNHEDDANNLPNDDPCKSVLGIENDGTITKLSYSYNNDLSFVPNEKCYEIIILSIGENAGHSCNFKKIDLSKTKITFIAASAFYNTENLTELILPNTIETIGLDAFKYSKITTVKLPQSLQSFDGAFNACGSLETITIENNQSQYFVVDNNIVFSIDYKRVIRAGNEIKTYNDIPHHDKVTELVSYAFSTTNIQKYRGTKNLQIIGNGVFESCEDLFEVNLIETQVKTIKSYCFKSSKIEFLVLPPVIEEIEKSAFQYCSLVSLFIPSSIKNIQEDAFASQKKDLRVFYFGDYSFDDRTIFSTSEGGSVEIFVPYSYKYDKLAKLPVTICNIDEMFIPQQIKLRLSTIQCQERPTNFVPFLIVLSYSYNV